jgi:hypothetical protein
MSEHERYRFSVTVSCDDLAVVGCLRALAQFSQATGNNRIPWGGTKDADWRLAGQKVTFRFDSPIYRKTFVAQADRLLGGRWSVAAESDADPAKSQAR